MNDIPVWLVLSILPGWLALGLSLLQWWRDKRPRLVIAVSVTQKSLPMPDPPNIIPKATPVLSIYLSNPGHVPVYVRDLWFRLAKGKEFKLSEYNALYSEISQPFAVDPLRGYEFLVNTKDLIADLKDSGYSENNVVGYVKVRDELGKHYKSKKVRFAVSDLRPAETDVTQPAP